MRYLLQRPLPDELLSSVWLRTARRAGLPIGTVARALTGGRKWAPSFFHAGHLADLAPLLGMTPVELLWRHTVFPYASAFFELDVFEKALAAALSIGHAAAGMGAVTQSVSDHARYRRFCQVCAREDRKRWGESYWHRAHNLPGVLLCLAHNRVLRETELPTAGTRSWSYALPHEAAGERVLRARPGTFDVELARRSVAVLQRDCGWVGEVQQVGLASGGGGKVSGEALASMQVARPPSWYREALVKLGLLSFNRQVGVQQLIAWAQELVGGDVTRLGFLEKDANMAWLGLMVRPKIGIPFVPLKHLVFESLLGRVCGALPAGAAAEKAGPWDLNHVPTGPTGRTDKRMALRDRQYATAVETVVQGYLKRGERVRVCDALTAAGCWAAFRHERDKYPRVASVVQALRMSVASARQIEG
jgi:hypothetical protein